MNNSKIVCFLVTVFLLQASSCKLLKPFFEKNKKAKKKEHVTNNHTKDTSATVLTTTTNNNNRVDTTTVNSLDSIAGREIIKSQTIQYNTFSCKARMKYDANGNKQNFTTNFRLEKGKYIWASISGFGIEIARAYITPDSVKAINRLDKTYYLYSYKDIQKIINVELDFNTLQDLIVGNAIYTNGKIIGVKEFGNITNININGKNFSNQLTYNRTTKKLNQIQVQTSRGISSTSLLAILTNYILDNNVMVSSDRTFFIQDIKGNVELNMDINKQSFNEVLEAPFSIPKNFKKQK